MRSQLVYEMTDFSVRNSEKIQMMSFFTVIISALIVMGSSMNSTVDGLYSQQIPIYFLAFVFIFLVTMIGEYAAVWLHEEKLVHICRCACGLMVTGLALYELFLFFNFEYNSLSGLERPLSVSSFIDQLLS